MSVGRARAARAAALWSALGVLSAAGCSLAIDFDGLAGEPGAVLDGGDEGAAGHDGSTDVSTDGPDEGAPDADADAPKDSGPDACPTGHASCDGASDNGCETDLDTDVLHCGACSKKCPDGHGTPACAAGQCSITCDPGFVDCDGVPANGCEVDTKTDPSHCGGCDTACSPDHETPTCAAGLCVAACDPNFGDCDSDLVTNGCETDLGTTLGHCGTCDTVCGSDHGTASCTAGVCSIQCTPPYADCDGVNGNGCEVDTDTALDHCGACQTSCGTADGAPACSAGSCTIACDANRGDCNHLNGDGCEADLKTDAVNCGACGHDCEGGSCVSGACLPVVIAGSSPVVNNPSGLAFDADNVYFTALGSQPGYVDGVVYQAPRHGGASIELATGLKSPTGVVAVGGQVYFTEAGTPGAGFTDGSVSVVPVGGGAVTPLRTGLAKPWGVAADSSNVYWLENGAGSLWSCVATACAATETNLASSLAAPKWLTLASGVLYWTNSGDGTVSGCAIAGCTGGPTVLASPGSSFAPTGIVADAQRVYWTNFGGSSVQSVALGGGPPSTIASVQSGPTGVAVDGASAYWTNATGGQVMTASLSGGAASLVAAAAYPTSIVADATQLFWVSFGDGTIVKLVK